MAEIRTESSPTKVLGREPTDDMVKAVRKLFLGDHLPDFYKLIWKTMYDAAPEATQDAGA